MKFRRLATTVAATSALVLTATGPAFADHADPFATFDANDVKGGNLKTCEGLVEDALIDDGFDAELFWQKSQDNVDSVDDVFDPPHPWFDLELSPDLTRLTVTAHSVPEGDFLVVLVKGSNATNMFVGPPFADPLFAPVNGSDDHAAISNFTICKFKGEKQDGQTPSPTPTPTTSTTPTPTEPGGMGGGESTETPAAVPTEIPAGTGTAGAGSAGTAGLIAMLAAFAAGAAVIVRRRFLTES